MKKYTLYVGLNDKDERVQMIDTIRAKKMVHQILNHDMTMLEGEGRYIHQDGGVSHEVSLKIELVDLKGELEKTIRGKVAKIKQVLNQETVAVQVEEVVSELW